MTYSLCLLELNNNKFQGNIAANHGGAIKWLYKMPININNNTFINNKAVYGNNIGSFPVSLNLNIEYSNNKSEIKINLTKKNYYYHIKNIESGKKLRYFFIFSLMDTENEIIYNIPKSKIFSSIETNFSEIKKLNSHFDLNDTTNYEYFSSLTTLAGQTFANMDKKSQMILNSLTITSRPSSIIYLKIRCTDINSYVSQYLNKRVLNNYNNNGKFLFFLPFQLSLVNRDKFILMSPIIVLLVLLELILFIFLGKNVMTALNI